MQIVISLNKHLKWLVSKILEKEEGVREMQKIINVIAQPIKLDTICSCTVKEFNKTVRVFACTSVCVVCMYFRFIFVSLKQSIGADWRKRHLKKNEQGKDVEE